MRGRIPRRWNELISVYHCRQVRYLILTVGIVFLPRYPLYRIAKYFKIDSSITTHNANPWVIIW